jgi:hypothetical protein
MKITKQIEEMDEFPNTLLFLFFKVCTNASIPYTNGCPAQLSMIKPKTYMLV